MLIIISYKFQTALRRRLFSIECIEQAKARVTFNETKKEMDGRKTAIWDNVLKQFDLMICLERCARSSENGSI